MISVIFVHGISVRRADYRPAFARIQEALDRRTSNVRLVPCLWGDDFGANLRGGGASIPRYRKAKRIEEQPSSLEEQDRWDLLTDDPFLELRLLALRPPATSPEFDPRGTVPPSQLLEERIRSFSPSASLRGKLGEGGITDAALDFARKGVIENPVFHEALCASDEDLGEFQLVWARAVISMSISESDDAVRTDLDSTKKVSPAELATALAGEVGNQPKGLLGDWLDRALLAVATRLVGSRLESSRGHYTDLVVPFVGDVLVYQGNGQSIRDLIATSIVDAGEDSPVVLLGHSLGGIACVDLLAEKSFRAVKLLITVGSQSPLLYEMNALQKIRFDAPLPDHFPKWLNIYDERDFLSYVAAPVFKDQSGRVVDFEVNNRQRFPRSHSAYWENPSVWDMIVSQLAEAAR